MKKLFLIILFVFFVGPGISGADDFLGVPLIPSGKTNLKTEGRLEMTAKQSHDEVKSFYKKKLKGYKDIKFRDWKDATYIEDDGNRPWHSITISKVFTDGTGVIIVKDNWTWIIGTLILRYIGVFVVLLLLFIGISVSGAIIARSVKKVNA